MDRGTPVVGATADGSKRRAAIVYRKHVPGHRERDDQPGRVLAVRRAGRERHTRRSKVTPPRVGSHRSGAKRVSVVAPGLVYFSRCTRAAGTRRGPG